MPLFLIGALVGLATVPTVRGLLEMARLARILRIPISQERRAMLAKDGHL